MGALDFPSICEWVLRQEDAALSGQIVNLMDGQGLTRFGIGQQSHPEVDSNFWTTMDFQTALNTAVSVYKKNYWDKFMGDQLRDVDVAASMLSFTVNDGLVGPIKRLQAAAAVTADGVFGPISLAAVNGYRSGILGPIIRKAQEMHYQMMVAAQPTDQRFLAGWLKRAALVYPDLTGFV
jgi:lysozyme family protein